jgi:hypothetical protein
VKRGDWPPPPTLEEIAERLAQNVNPYGREVRLSLVSPAGGGIAPGTAIENADATCPVSIEVEVTCDMGWHYVGTVALPIFPSRPGKDK